MGNLGEDRSRFYDGVVVYFVFVFRKFKRLICRGLEIGRIVAFSFGLF